MRIALLAAALAAWPALALAQDASTTTTAPVSTATTAAPAARPSATTTTSAARPQSASTATTGAQPQVSDEAAAQLTAPDAHEAAREKAFFDSLQRRTGVITIAGGRVSINVPQTYYFVGPEDARRILCDEWGNPPEAADGVDGMIFPADGNPAAGSWGAVLQYSSEGHVSDSDERTTNYTELLHTMQQQVQDNNAQRRQSHFPELTLVGWAEAPHYDAATHEVYWAKELSVSDNREHVLNYDIRVLGREGYLIVSFVSRMSELQQIRQNTPAMLAIPHFTPGNTYADYREGVDQRAAYGIGGLIAGGAVAAIAQKTGLLALILAFGKKFIVLIIAGLAAIGRGFARFFGGRKNQDPPDTPS